MAHPTAAELAARLDRLPITRHVWKLVALISLGGCFEFYDLFLTAYVAPAWSRRATSSPSRSASSTSSGRYGAPASAPSCSRCSPGCSSARSAFRYVADHYGRRAIFAFSLLWSRHHHR